jgi:hypothetical protein
MNKKQKKRYKLSMFLWSIIAIIWFILSIRYFNKGDLVGGILYILVGISYIFFGHIITKQNIKKIKK